jgi:uncharacterized protein (TIGR02996 family)
VDERTLFQALADAPDDEAPRAVFADWLLERGDPMSEFVSLQAVQSSGLDTLQAQRAQDLLIMNWKRWMGPLCRALHRRSCVFEGGFLRDADAEVRAADPALASALRDAPQWATVRRLQIEGDAASVARVLESGWLKNLRDLRCSAAAVVRASRLAFCLETLDLSGSEAARLEPQPAWQHLSRLTLREFDFPLATLALTPRELYCSALEIRRAVELVQQALDLARAPEKVVVSTDGWRLSVARGGQRVEASTSTFSSLDARALRTLGEVELEATFGARIWRGPAKGFDWG